MQAYQRVREIPQKADIFRLALLVAEGGVYVDADDRCLRPLDTLLPAGASLVLSQEEFGCAANHFLAASPGHPVLQAALRAVVMAVNAAIMKFLGCSPAPACSPGRWRSIWPRAASRRVCRQALRYWTGGRWGGPWLRAASPPTRPTICATASASTPPPTAKPVRPAIPHRSDCADLGFAFRRFFAGLGLGIRLLGSASQNDPGQPLQILRL